LNKGEIDFEASVDEAIEAVSLIASSRLSIIPSDKQRHQLKRLSQTLAQYNEHTNLVSKADPYTLSREHILDSLSVLPVIGARPTGESPCSLRLIDIGSGAGFPALILAIMMPTLEAVLVEATEKKCRFLRQITTDLEIGERVSVINDRAELLAHQVPYREVFELATARAIGSFGVVAELCLPFLAIGGRLLVQKTAAQLAKESQTAHATLSKLGGVVEEVVPINTAVANDKVIVVVKKTSKTPEEFPRPWSKIKS
jgi:16S rRNA (guanine527-N7)-methyltransferase